MSHRSPVQHPVAGAVSFDNLMALRHAGEAVIATAEGPVEMQLGGLDGGNSAAVALLMAWLRAAARAGVEVTFVDVPPEVRKIVELSGLVDVLPMRPARAAEPDRSLAEHAADRG